MISTPDPKEMIIRDHIQRIAPEWPTYGYRTITAELGRHYKKRAGQSQTDLAGDGRR